MVADRAAERRVTGLERVEDRAQRDRRLDGEFDLAVELGQHAQVIRQHDTNHDSV